MKKILFLAVVAAAGYAVWRKIEDDRLERELWAEVTDAIA